MDKPRFSIIVPVYNRPEEVEELLFSLTKQTLSNYEVIIVEDGSNIPSQEIVERYKSKLNLQYFSKPNTGPGTTRNYGAERAKGEYLIFFDSDCIIPEQYLEEIEKELSFKHTIAFGGPDRAHSSFTPTQKAINYSMTSFFTTGGIRGNKKSMDKFQPRSFNMGISKEAFRKIGGFCKLRFGEDIDLSIRIAKAGYSMRLFPEAFVFHKRRTDFRKFYRQVFNSGIARINLHIIHPGSLKLVHLLPASFVIAMVFIFAISIFLPIVLVIPALYSLLVLFHSLLLNSSFKVACLSIPAAWVQLLGYGLGFIISSWKRLVLKKNEFSAFQKNFYK